MCFTMSNIEHSGSHIGELLKLYLNVWASHQYTKQKNQYSKTHSVQIRIATHYSTANVHKMNICLPLFFSLSF